jgi:hypothetical protein
VAATSILMAWTELGPDGRIMPLLEMEADGGTLREDRKSGTFQRALARIYRRGSLVARLRAPRVEATLAAHRVEARGGVVLTSVQPEGLRVDADRVAWLLDQSRVVAIGRVRFVQTDAASGTRVAEGGEFRQATLDTKRWRLTIP